MSNYIVCCQHLGICLSTCTAVSYNILSSLLFATCLQDMLKLESCVECAGARRNGTRPWCGSCKPSLA